jgi:hypothetical protein
MKTVSEYHKERAKHNLSVALEYAEAGVPVFPCKDRSTVKKNGKPDGGPHTENGFEDATTDPKRIKACWREHPTAVPGIPTGAASGLAVLDLDRKDGKDGLAAIKAWGFDPERTPAAVVDTPSGAVHLIFKHRPGLTCSATHLPKGVDVRAEGGIIIPHGAWDSRGRYEARSGDFLIDLELGLPEWPAALMPPERPGSEPQGEPGEEDPETVRDALLAIPSDCQHDEWVEVLMALHHETGGSDDGLALALEWSHKDYPADDDEVRAKWRSFRRRKGGVRTVGTIYRRAMAEGWTRPLEEVSDDVLALFDVLPDDPRPPTKSEWGAPIMRGDKPVINLTNTTLYLGRNLDSILPGLALNLMSGREEWDGGEVDDATVSLARMALERRGLERRGLEQVGKEMVGDAINVVARKLEWHPIRDYLDGLTWDGTARLDDWLVRHVGADDSPYVRAVGRKFLMQMVARVMAPGCKVDHTLVLSGPQGFGKSTLCHVLAGDDYFTDSMPSITKGDGIESSRHVAGKWLVELAELAPSRKSEAEDLKAFLSRSTDRVRRP